MLTCFQCWIFLLLQETLWQQPQNFLTCRLSILMPTHQVPQCASYFFQFRLFQLLEHILILRYQHSYECNFTHPLKCKHKRLYLCCSDDAMQCQRFQLPYDDHANSLNSSLIQNPIFVGPANYALQTHFPTCLSSIPLQYPNWIYQVSGSQQMPFRWWPNPACNTCSHLRVTFTFLVSLLMIALYLFWISFTSLKTTILC